MTRVRRQIYELTPEDLRAYPAWEFALDEEGEEGQDEATVRPWIAPEPITGDDAGLVLRAIFVLADGTEFPGYLTLPPAGEEGADSVQPVIVSKDGHVWLWHGVLAPGTEWVRDAYRRLGGSSESVFPLRYSSDVPRSVARVAGIVNGFMHYRSMKDRRVVEAK